MFCVQLSKIRLEFMSGASISSEWFVEVEYSHLSCEVSVTVPQRVHLHHLSVPGAHQLFILVGVLVQHERGDAHRDRVLHVLIDVVYWGLITFTVYNANLILGESD